MTESEKNIYWLNWKRFQQRYEKKYQSKFNKALKIQLDSYLKSRDVTSIPSFPIYTILNDLYFTVGPAWARFIKKDTKKAGGSMGFSEEIVRLMRNYYTTDLLNDAELMTQCSREVIVNVLSIAAQEGWSYDRVTTELLKHPEFNRMRAMRIARTETVTAANGAAVLYAQNSGIKMDKIWIAIRDKRTRHSHESVDTSPIPINQEFRVGGSLMMQPGVRKQNNGFPVPGYEIVNCRCTVAFIPKRDQNGRIISN